jgi:hypothetical protein
LNPDKVDRPELWFSDPATADPTPTYIVRFESPGAYTSEFPDGTRQVDAANNIIHESVLVLGEAEATSAWATIRKLARDCK